MRDRKVGETSDTTLGIKEPGQKLRRALTALHRLLCREEEDHWEVMEERRRRRIAFENLAKSMLGYLDYCNDVKVGVTELQERVEVFEQIGISIQ